MRSVQRPDRARERGETLVEFAFASVIFFAMIFGAIEFGLAVWKYNMVSNLAQAGARYAIVHGVNSGDPKNEAQVGTFVQNDGFGMNLTVTTPLGPPSGKSIGAVVEVRVTYTLDAGGGLLPVWNIPIFSTASMVMAR